MIEKKRLLEFCLEIGKMPASLCNRMYGVGWFDAILHFTCWLTTYKQNTHRDVQNIQDGCEFGADSNVTALKSSLEVWPHGQQMLEDREHDQHCREVMPRHTLFCSRSYTL